MIAANLLMIATTLCSPVVGKTKDYGFATEVTFIIKPGCPANGVAFLRFSSRSGGMVPTTGFIELNRYDRTAYRRLIPKWWVVEYLRVGGEWKCMPIAKTDCRDV